jgi:hypothetical protein
MTGATSDRLSNATAAKPPLHVASAAGQKTGREARRVTDVRRTAKMADLYRQKLAIGWGCCCADRVICAAMREADPSPSATKSAAQGAAILLAGRIAVRSARPAPFGPLHVRGLVGARGWVCRSAGLTVVLP